MSVDAVRGAPATEESPLRAELDSWEQLEAVAAMADAEEASLSAVKSGHGPAIIRRRQRVQILRASFTNILAVGTAVVTTLAFSPAGDSLGPGAPFLGPALIAILWVAVLSSGEKRAVRRGASRTQQVRRVLRVSCAFFGAVAVVAVVTEWGAGKWYLLVALPVGLVLILSLRGLATPHPASGRRRSGQNARRALLLGTVANTQLCELALREQGTRSGYEVISTFSLGDCGCARSGGAEDRVSAAVDAATRSGVDTVILTDSAGLSALAVRELGWRLSALDISLLMGASLHEVAAGRLWVESVGGLPLIHVEYPRLQGAPALMKRCFDVVFSLTALVVVTPILVLAAAAVAVESHGPVLFRQKRVGLDHRLFTMFKVRSMSVDAEAQKAQLQESSEGNEVLFKIRQDPRVTRVGRVIRRFSIDELPQFFNVLIGDMSVVGPRPALPVETESYDDHADRRVTVKPGITGLWQIGGRSDLTWEQSLRLDTYYVENWSLTADIAVVIKTVRAVFRGSGAY